MNLARISRELSDALRDLPTPGVAMTYNPLDYARRPHEAYLKKWGLGPKKVVLVGMNPGPFGMAQTGVPFGDVSMVRDFLGIEASVDRPPVEHPKRPVLGFQCPRSEVSGTRLWGWARDQFGSPEVFFADFFVVNFCPLVFMSESGANLTPDKLDRKIAAPLFSACDEALRQTVRILKPEWVIGVGGFAEKAALRALGTASSAAAARVRPPRIATILHPSPASPAANRGWAPQVQRQLEELGVFSA